MTVRLEYGRTRRPWIPDPLPMLVEYECPACTHMFAPEILVFGRGRCPRCERFVPLTGVERSITTKGR